MAIAYMKNEIIKQKTVVEQVLNAIKESVLTGKFPIGEKIPTEPKLAELFGIGRSSVREAVKILQYLGVLEVRPSKGTFVRTNTNVLKEILSWTLLLGKKDIFELVELRKIIEKAALEDFIGMKHISGEEWDRLVADLEKNCENMRLSETPEMFIEHDYAFHSTIIEGSGNSTYIDIYKALTAFMHREIKLAIWNWINEIFVIDRSEVKKDQQLDDSASITRMEKLQEYNERMHMHVSILKAIKDKNLAEAIVRLDAHINSAKESIETYLRIGSSDNN